MSRGQFSYLYTITYEKVSKSLSEYNCNCNKNMIYAAAIFAGKSRVILRLTDSIPSVSNI